MFLFLRGMKQEKLSEYFQRDDYYSKVCARTSPRHQKIVTGRGINDSKSFPVGEQSLYVNSWSFIAAISNICYL